ncbi:MAG TPA: ABC transporter permease [Gemmatimonadaceae bacterium]
MMRVLKVLLRKEYLQIFRDKLLVRQMLIMPFVQIFLLASAATFEVKTARVYLVDRDTSQTSRGLVDRLRASGRFKLVDGSASMKLANEALLARHTDMILSIPVHFEQDVVRTRAAHVQLVFNAEDGALAGVTNSYAQQIIAAYSQEIGAKLSSGAADAPRIEMRTRGWYNAELNYKHYMVPGILVQLLTLIGTLVTAMNIVREKEIGTLDQLNVTPLPRSAFIAAKLIPLLSIAIAMFAAGLAIARFAYGVPIIGSITLLFFCAVIYLLVALGVGLWISTIVNTQQQAMFVAFFLILIYLLMSGLFTPVRSMPEWAQWMAEVNPVKHFIVILRSVMLKGAGLSDILRPLGILVVTGVVALTLAVRQYGKQAH